MPFRKMLSFRGLVFLKVTLLEQHVRLKSGGIHNVPCVSAGALLGLDSRYQRRTSRAVKSRFDERILFLERRQYGLGIGNRYAGIENQLPFLSRAFNNLFGLCRDIAGRRKKDQSQ